MFKANVWLHRIAGHIFVLSVLLSTGIFFWGCGRVWAVGVWRGFGRILLRATLYRLHCGAYAVPAWGWIDWICCFVWILCMTLYRCWGSNWNFCGFWIFFQPLHKHNIKGYKRKIQWITQTGKCTDKPPDDTQRTISENSHLLCSEECACRRNTL